MHSRASRCLVVVYLKGFQFLREFWIREIRYANYHVAVGLLVGLGWEQRQPTQPK